MKSALITGISGQDGSYLAEYLLGLGYQVWGLVRREAVSMRWPLAHLLAHRACLRRPARRRIARGGLPEGLARRSLQSGGAGFVPTSWECRPDLCTLTWAD